MKDLTLIIIVCIYFIATHLNGKYIGRKRAIGYGKSILWSILFSPIIGLIITLLSKRVDDIHSSTKYSKS